MHCWRQGNAGRESACGIPRALVGAGEEAGTAGGRRPGRPADARTAQGAGLRPVERADEAARTWFYGHGRAADDAARRAGGRRGAGAGRWPIPSSKRSNACAADRGFPSWSSRTGWRCCSILSTWSTSCAGPGHRPRHASADRLRSVGEKSLFRGVGADLSQRRQATKNHKGRTHHEDTRPPSITKEARIPCGSSCL